ncbi:hypothetical protein L6164_022606 [Bauhinia variegata]|uniref:Uncharacterized protein n=1 Tax=Bauhinia variegata TaxID=167791 RepID=A0ACB9MH15_BAUVA|nr:hypothetical protein L6164_022606 [Bauhinia variegata]
MANRFPFLTSISNQRQVAAAECSSQLLLFRVDDAVAGATKNPDRPVIDLEAGDTKNDEDHKRGVTGFVADIAKQGTMKATEVVENIADAAKETVDTAWDATKNTAQNIRDTTTAEYRSSEDLKGQLGDGHDSRIKI